jgi:hypothetical protein
MSQSLLEGEVRQDDAVRLKREIAGLEQELEEVKAERDQLKQASADSIQAIRALRKLLDPFHTVLRMIYGEISRIDVGQIGVESNGNNSASVLSPKWQMLKTKLGGRQAEFIDLLQHGPMTAAQLRAAAHCDIRTAYSVIERMKAGGLLDKNGGKFSLKDL